MSTIGHPLSDLSNLLTPFTTASIELARKIGRGSEHFLPGKVPGLPTKEQCISWYREVAGWDPSSDILWGEAFGVYRNSIIMQGIAARQALRQASSAKAAEYANSFKPFGEVAWILAQASRSQDGRKKAKL